MYNDGISTPCTQTKPHGSEQTFYLTRKLDLNISKKSVKIVVQDVSTLILLPLLIHVAR